MQRFDEGWACASTGCTSGFLLSPWTHLVSVAQLSSPLPLLVLYLAVVGPFFQGLLQVSASLCVWVLFGIPNTISGRHCPPGHRGCLLSSAPEGARLARGLSCREFVPWHLYLTQQSTG